MKRLRIGISSCLLGDEVRFDGGHKRDAPLLESLAPHVEWVRVCPEVELGMGVPREPVQLVKSAAGLRMIAVHTGTDYTDAMRAFAARRVAALAGMDLRGYILKSDSPSCGLDTVKVFDDDAEPSRSGTGLFAAALTSAFPAMPIEDERRLGDPEARTRFLERVTAYDRSCAQARVAPPESLTPARAVPVFRVSGAQATETIDKAAAEEPLDIRLHGRSFAVIMRTPGQDRALAAGFLLSERSSGRPTRSPRSNTAAIPISARRTTSSTSSCAVTRRRVCRRCSTRAAR